jgi:hypothetical protein
MNAITSKEAPYESLDLLQPMMDSASAVTKILSSTAEDMLDSLKQTGKNMGREIGRAWESLPEG